MRPSVPSRPWIARALCLLSAALPPAMAAPARAADAGAGPTTKPAPAVTVAFRADDFEYKGDWVEQNDQRVPVLWSAPDTAGRAAATAVRVPRAGRYRLWVCAKDFAQDRPGTRTFAVRLGATRADRTFGTHGQDGYAWEDGGWFDLPAGPLLVCIEGQKPFARAQGVLLTTDPKLQPAKPVAAPGGPRPVDPLPVAPAGGPREPELRVTSDVPAASLSNEHLRIEFLPAARGDVPTFAVRAHVRAAVGGAWVDAGADPAAEGYFVVRADASAKKTHQGFYPQWPQDPRAEPVTVEAGGSSVRTIPGRATRALYEAGARQRFIPSKVTAGGGNAARVEFHPSPAGQLEAVWELPAGARAASVAMTFTPASDGQAALGYELFVRRDLAQVSEVLLPMMWQRHRLPRQPTTLLDNCTPTPLSLVEPVAKDGEPLRVFAVTGEPADVPFAWPDGREPRFAMSIAGVGGRVQPSIWGPVIGTPAATARAGQPMRLRFRVLVQAGDWYAGYRTAADHVYGLRDYRSNVTTSLTDAALNMADLLMDDEHGGWWERAKAFYQIESKNGSTHASPLALLSLYRLRGDDEAVYRRRALPMLQFMLSRDGPHFAPEPADTGVYPAGSMNGPSKLFGTSTYGGLWELTGRRTNAFRDIALPPDGQVRSTAGYSHAQAFDEWLARYELTGDRAALDRACELADKYVQAHVRTPPAKDLGPQPFFYISFVPNWEGLLRLYEATGRKEYLDAAAFGARQLMTGVWTQPVIPDGAATTTIHPDGVFVGDARHLWWKGPRQFRLNWPAPPGATPERSAPAWAVSNVGLGFEQPSTFNASGPARNIYEAAWAPHFWRLYRYTKEPAFQTYARNATLGRWANYAGYYAMGQTDLPLDPRYPTTGPDVTSIYYHHIAPRLAWTIDYLISEAEALSDGRIAFPSLRQHGYAYFDSRVFGHAPGRVFDDAAARLVLRRGIVSLDNVQANYLTAQGADALHVILTNQSQAEQVVNVAVSREGVDVDAGRARGATLRVGSDEPVPVAFDEGRARVTLPPRALAVLRVPGATVKGWSDDAPPAGAGPAGGVVAVEGDPAGARAAALRVKPGAWDAYVWSKASPAEAKAARFRYAVGDQWREVADEDYPFEFSLPMTDENVELRFRVDLTRVDGTVVEGREGRLSVQP